MKVFDTPWDASEMNCDGAGLGGVGKCDSNAASQRHTASWSNAFAFPWEVGMYHNLKGKYKLSNFAKIQIIKSKTFM